MVKQRIANPFVLAVSLVCVLLSSGSAVHGADPASFRIAGYLPDYRCAEYELDQGIGVTDLILFSAELHRDGSILLDRLKLCPWSKLADFQAKQSVALWLTVGGWGRSEHFASVASSPQRRKQCVENLLQLCRHRNLKGIDLDWEHPKDEHEMQSYCDLISDLGLALHAQGRKLSVTIAPWQTLSQKAFQSCDYVQVMSYDHPGKHSTLTQSKTDIRKLLSANVPANKLVLGVPFYGRDIHSRQAKTYHEIVTSERPPPSSDQIGSLYFNGSTTIEKKTKFVLQQKLAGIMIWELGQDSNRRDSLLGAIVETVRNDRDSSK